MDISEREHETTIEQEKREQEPRRFVRPENACPDPSNVIGVFGMSSAVKETDLINHFSEFGKVQKAYVVCDRFTQESRGFGFVYFENIDEAKLAIEKTSGTQFFGREIRVDYSLTEKPHDPTPGRFFGKTMRPRGYGRPMPYYGRYERPDDRYARRPRYGYEGPRYTERGYRDERYPPRYMSRYERRPLPYNRGYEDRNSTREQGNPSKDHPKGGTYGEF